MDNILHISNVTAKGQITIPAKIRKALSIDKHSRVMFERKGEGITVIPLKRDISNIFGMAKKLGIKTLSPKKAEKRMREIVAREIAQEGQ